MDIILFFILGAVAFVVLGILGWVFKAIGFGVDLLWEGVKSVLRGFMSIFWIIMAGIFFLFVLMAVI